MATFLFGTTLSGRERGATVVSARFKGAADTLATADEERFFASIDGVDVGRGVGVSNLDGVADAEDGGGGWVAAAAMVSERD